MVKTEFHSQDPNDQLLTAEEKRSFQRLILAAKNAYTNPTQSGYRVRTAAFLENGRVVRGGNKENSLSDAYVHGETAVVSRARDLYKKVPILAIGFYSSSQNLAELGISPCGACRDVVSQYCGPNLVMMEGNEKVIKHARLKEFLFSKFNSTKITEVDLLGVEDAVVALNQAVDVYLPERLKPAVYGISLIDKNKRVFRGSLYTNAGYDALPPGLVAVQTHRNTVGPENPLADLEKIIVVGFGSIPNVLYRDRQALLEHDEVLRLNANRKEPLPVYLLNVNPDTGQIVAAATTNTAEWLPHPFSAGTFGMHDVIHGQYEKLMYWKT